MIRTGFGRPILRGRRETVQRQDCQCRQRRHRFMPIVLRVSPRLRKTYHVAKRSRSGGRIVRATTKLRALLTSGRIAVAPGAYRRAVGAAGRAGRISGDLRQRRRHRALGRRAGSRPALRERDRRPARFDGRCRRRADHRRRRYRLRQCAQCPGRRARLRARRRRGLSSRGPDVSQEVRSLRRQEPRAGGARWCRSSRPCAMPCTIPISS